MYFRLFKRNVIIRFPFFAYAKVSIEGNGSVFIDRCCSVYLNVFSGLSISTLSSDSKVTIGKKCILGGLTIRCHKAITIKDRTMTAYSLVQDGLFADQRATEAAIVRNRALEPRAVFVGSNVWLGGHCIILSGCQIGDDSVVSAGAVCFDACVNPSCLVSGNVATRSLPIDGLLRFRKQS